MFHLLCFTWENLVLACGVCNGAGFKGDHFPDEVEGDLMVNPTQEEPKHFFDFVIDPHTRIAEVLPKHERGVTTERILGLNRNDLIRHRSKAVLNLFQLGIMGYECDLKSAALLIENCKPAYEYAAFARTIADRFGIEWRS